MCNLPRPWLLLGTGSHCQVSFIYIAHFKTTAVDPKCRSRPHTGAVGPGFLLVQDCAQPHVGRVCKQIIAIDITDWPSHSPDLNPIKNLWDIINQCIWRHHIVPQTAKFTGSVIQVWEEISQDSVQFLLRPLFGTNPGYLEYFYILD